MSGRDEAFTGIVLTGGASRRMGRDKAFVAPDDGGPVLAERARRALVEAGAATVLAVGGDLAGLELLGFEGVADHAPGEGPLGGLVAGLEAASTEVAVVLSCDLPEVNGATVLALLSALSAAPAADAALPGAPGRWEVLVGAYRRSVYRQLADAFAAGERSVRRAVSGLAVVPCDVPRTDALRDVDHPADLDHYARGRHSRESPGEGGRPSGPAAPTGPSGS